MCSSDYEIGREQMVKIIMMVVIAMVMIKGSNLEIEEIEN
jgi:hypothetical protein